MVGMTRSKVFFYFAFILCFPLCWFSSLFFLFALLVFFKISTIFSVLLDLISLKFRGAQDGANALLCYI